LQQLDKLKADWDLPSNGVSLFVSQWLTHLVSPSLPEKSSDFPGIQLTRVYVGVLLHVRLLVEPLAAILAGIWPGIAVDEQMRGQGG